MMRPIGRLRICLYSREIMIQKLTTAKGNKILYKTVSSREYPPVSILVPYNTASENIYDHIKIINKRIPIGLRFQPLILSTTTVTIMNTVKINVSIMAHFITISAMSAFFQIGATSERLIIYNIINCSIVNLTTYPK